MLDFGKIIIYTSNLRIIPAPQRRRESEGEARGAGQDQGGGGEEASKGHGHRSRGKHRTKCGHGNKEMTPPKPKVAMVAIISILTGLYKNKPKIELSCFLCMCYGFAQVCSMVLGSTRCC